LYKTLIFFASFNSERQPVGREAPPSFTVGKRVVVTVEDEQAINRKQKLALLKKSVRDPLFQRDVQEVANDFDPLDEESL